MSGGRKQILSPFTGCKNRKACNKTRIKYMPNERRQNLAEKDRGSYYNQEEWLEEFSDDKLHFTMVIKVMVVKMMMRIVLTM